MKKIISLILALIVMFSAVPGYDMRASAASTTYYETAKDSVALRYAKGEKNSSGEDNEIVSRVASKGTVVKLIKTEYHTPLSWLPTYKTTWHKVSVASGTTNNDKSGEFWIYDGNVTAHKHSSLAAGACTAAGCDYVKSIDVVDSNRMTMEITRDGAPVRKEPYDDGEVVNKLKQGQLITVTNKVKNYKTVCWYKLANGNYIYSGNVKKASEKKTDAETNDVNNSGGSSILDMFQPIFSELPCYHLVWYMGKCVNCGKVWQLETEAVSGTYKANKDLNVLSVPYKQGSKTGKSYSKGDVVPVIGRAKNSAGNYWYRTSDGWVYDVGNVSLKSVKLSLTGYTFNLEGDTVTPKVTIVPENAAIESIVWTSDAPKYAEVDFVTGKITPKAAGNAKITCTVTSNEGTVKTATVNVKVTEELFLEKWDHTYTTFDEELALECSGYSSLAYPSYDYVYENGKLIVFKSDSKPKTPNNLTRLLTAKGFSYKVSDNYYDMQMDNSPYVLAHKMVKYNNKKTPVIYVIIEGSAGLPGWKGNMLVTGYSYDSSYSSHLTFEQSAENIRQGLERYKEENNLSKPLVVITGHSRGAAAGNLLAAKINGSSEYNRIYAYLFATPNTTKDREDYKNIYNICNESDLVPYIPLSTSKWGYEKHGKHVSFDSAFLADGEYGPYFMNYANKIFKLSKGSEKPDYKWSSKTPDEMRDYINGKWKSVSEYYKHNPNTYDADHTEAFYYFFEGLAPAACDKGTDEIEAHLFCNCPFRTISWFLAGNGKFGKSFADSHEMLTYHAAMLSGMYDSGGRAFIFSDGSDDTAELNTDEKDALYSFFTQSENELMLELAGWDIEDYSTWEGIKWNTDGNVISMDLSYMNLGGWLNANSFPKLQDLNIDGNSINMLAVSGCSELVNLSCMDNNISTLSVNNCSSLQNLDCSYNNLQELDASGMSSLSQINCFGNSLSSINLSGASALSTLKCGNNELTDIDISTNTSLNEFYCDNNYIREEDCKELVSGIEAINLNGGSAYIGTQKYNENYSFNANELAYLTDFANMSLNMEKLGWDMENPYTWDGVEWKLINGEYRITDIDLGGLGLEGDFILRDAEYVESVSCDNSSLAAVNLSGCTSLSTLSCAGAGISDLAIEDCASLESINCNDNYLEIEDVESSLNQIGLNTGIATYETQNISADEESFNQAERDVLISFLSTGNNAEILGWDWDWPGTWDGIVWIKADGEYRVNKINFSGMEVCGELDMSAFGYLEDFNFSGTLIETVILPGCVTKIPEYAFSNSNIRYIHMAEGITNIEQSAFAMCDNLITVVLPSSVTRIYDNAFYGSSNLKNLVFLGSEPIETGSEIASGTSQEFRIMYFADSVWDGTSGLLDEYFYEVSTCDYILLCEDDITLESDDFYGETNNYPGHDVKMTVVSKSPGDSVDCLLAVYNEDGSMNSAILQSVNAERYMNTVLFEDVNIQYAGDNYCFIKSFLWSDKNSLKPVASKYERLLEKTVSE